MKHIKLFEQFVNEEIAQNLNDPKVLGMIKSFVQKPNPADKFALIYSRGMYLGDGELNKFSKELGVPVTGKSFVIRTGKTKPELNALKKQFYNKFKAEGKADRYYGVGFDVVPISEINLN